MDGDQRRIELGDHDDAAKHGLRHDRARLSRRQPEQVRRRRPPGGRNRQAAMKTPMATTKMATVTSRLPNSIQRWMSESPVAPDGGQALRRAVRPVRAAEAGLAEPDRRPGQDDQRRGDDAGERPAPQTRPGSGRAARPRPPRPARQGDRAALSPRAVFGAVSGADTDSMLGGCGRRAAGCAVQVWLVPVAAGYRGGARAGHDDQDDRQPLPDEQRLAEQQRGRPAPPRPAPGSSRCRTCRPGPGAAPRARAGRESPRTAGRSPGPRRSRPGAAGAGPACRWPGR